MAMNKKYDKKIDIPILEGEEFWSQKAIDHYRNGRYKVSYYMGSGVAFKWFNSFEEATDFSLKLKPGDVIEVKWYPNNVK